eukprot:c5399_g1_i1.p1 GENE.c5399_g1_i1~~c5399_g1_i1.p1  ORF type:complete len:671 (+),score=149.68 c5399_g1_i1:88-2013(+)
MSENIALSHVLVIYTGGTIGMVHTENGYAPKKDFFISLLRASPIFHDPTFILPPEQVRPDILVTPPSAFDRRVVYHIMEYEPLVDSSNMDMKDWKRIASDIHRHYQEYEAFVVLHGTDTMAYTASALSFMFENLGKTIIITGSQVPLTEQRNDARENLLGALTIAGHFCIPEVLLMFNNQLLRGNRSQKVNSSDYAAFDSPNLSPIAKMGITIDVHWQMVYRPTEIKAFGISLEMDPNIGALRLFPGITDQTVKSFLQPPMRGVVLQTYGSGNAPDNRPALLDALAEASKRGVVIVNITQCARGHVSDDYAAGRSLVKCGVIPGADMTTECALAKLSYLFGKGHSPEKVRELIQHNLRGELTVFSKVHKFSFEDVGFVRKLAAAVQAHDDEEVTQVSKVLMPTLLCSAAGNGDIAGIQSIIRGGFDVNCADYDRRTPLHVAASAGNIEIVELLLLNGASVFARDRFNRTPLLDAVENRQAKVVALLVQAGAKMTNVMQLGAKLCSAAVHNEVDRLKLFVAAGADINSSDYDKRTALHLAAAEGRVEAVRYLLTVPTIKANEPDRWGNTPLMEAKRREGNDVIVKLLADKTSGKQHSGGILRRLSDAGARLKPKANSKTPNVFNHSSSSGAAAVFNDDASFS